MTVKRLLPLFLLLFIFSGCTDKDEVKQAAAPKAKAAEQEVLYQNKDNGLTIYKSGDWKKAKESADDQSLNLVFKNDQLHAIIAVIPEKDSVKSIKADLLKSVTNPKVLNETDASIDLEAGTKDKTHIVTYIKQHEKHTYIFSFITPAEFYSKKKSAINTFMDKVKINEE